MRKCYVGSLNNVKLTAVKEIMHKYDVIGVSVNSGVGKQPLSDDDTITGAYNRAIALPSDGLRLGLEAGVHLHGDIMFLVNWGVLIDGDGIVYYGGGTRIPLPDFVKSKLLSGNTELSVIMDNYLGTTDIKHKEGAIGYFTASLIKRKDIFTHIVRILYGQYLRKEKI